ncbi:MAG: type II toxin-antitoxin system RelE/ParE family toxin [Patescibacteria group bacterium]
MDKIEKLLRKAKKADREKLLAILESLQSGSLKGLHVKRLVHSPFYRIRVGDFRIIFSIDYGNKHVVIESISVRNEQTYK